MPEQSDLSTVRAALDVDTVRLELRRRGSTWPPVQAVATVDSTNAALVAAARDGADEGTVLVAEEQTTGRGRLGRDWVSPRGAGLTCSVLLRPSPPPGVWGWLPLMMGVALADAVRRSSDVDVALKWPNDLLIGPQLSKAAGVLAEATDGAVVLGVGVNVSTLVDELPTGATSLRLVGAKVTREALLVEMLAELDLRYAAWSVASGDAEKCGLAGAYRGMCATLGQQVRVDLPEAESRLGSAESIDSSGGLVVRTPEGGVTTVVAADVVHVRPIA